MCLELPAGEGFRKLRNLVVTEVKALQSRQLLQAFWEASKAIEPKLKLHKMLQGAQVWYRGQAAVCQVEVPQCCQASELI